MILEFQGEDAYGWLIKIEKYFSAVITTDAERLPESVKALKGLAVLLSSCASSGVCPTLMGLADLVDLLEGTGQMKPT